MPAYQFVVLESSKSPRSGYAARIRPAQWAEIEPFVRTLHTEHFTKKQIRERLLTDRNITVTDGQLQSQMQKWGMSSYKVGARLKSASTSSVESQSETTETESASSVYGEPISHECQDETVEDTFDSSQMADDRASRLQTAEMLFVGRQFDSAFTLFASVLSAYEFEASSAERTPSGWRMAAVLGCLKSAVDSKQSSWAVGHVTPSFLESGSPFDRVVFVRYCQLVQLTNIARDKMRSGLHQVAIDTTISSVFWDVMFDLPSLSAQMTPVRSFPAWADKAFADSQAAHETKIPPFLLRSSDQVDMYPSPKDLMEICRRAIFNSPFTLNAINLSLNISPEPNREHALFETMYWRLLEEIHHRNITESSFGVQLFVSGRPHITLPPFEVAGIMSAIIATFAQDGQSSFELHTSMLAQKTEEIQRSFIWRMLTDCLLPNAALRRERSLIDRPSFQNDSFLKTLLLRDAYSFSRDHTSFETVDQSELMAQIDECVACDHQEAVDKTRDLMSEPMPSNRKAAKADLCKPILSQPSTSTRPTDLPNDPTLSRQLSASSVSFGTFASISRRLNRKSVKLNSRMSSVRSTFSNFSYMDVDSDLTTLLSHSMTISRESSLRSHAPSVHEPSSPAATTPAAVEMGMPQDSVIHQEVES